MNDRPSLNPQIFIQSKYGVPQVFDFHSELRLRELDRVHDYSTPLTKEPVDKCPDKTWRNFGTTQMPGFLQGNV
jgi:hypothetical protein